MSASRDLIQALKAELKRSRMTYADLARALGLAESSVKRMFSKGDMPLSRLDAICKALRLDFTDLARQMADAAPAVHELTLAQERAVVADPKLLLMAVCCLSQWTVEQVLAIYRYTEVECIKYLTRLDRLGVIELRPGNRYRLMLNKGGLRWRPEGPVMEFFRQRVAPEFFNGGFNGAGEQLTLVHGALNAEQAAQLNEKLQRVAQEFAQAHFDKHRDPKAAANGYTLVIGLRSWLYSAFADLQRN